MLEGKSKFFLFFSLLIFWFGGSNNYNINKISLQAALNTFKFEFKLISVCVVCTCHVNIHGRRGTRERRENIKSVTAEGQ